MVLSLSSGCTGQTDSSIVGQLISSGVSDVEERLLLHGPEFDEASYALVSVIDIAFESVESLLGLSSLLDRCSFRCEVEGFACSIERDKPTMLSRAACRSLRRRPGTVSRWNRYDGSKSRTVTSLSQYIQDPLSLGRFSWQGNILRMLCISGDIQCFSIAIHVLSTLLIEVNAFGEVGACREAGVTLFDSFRGA
jgi:hypothetical protein